MRASGIGRATAPAVASEDDGGQIAPVIVLTYAHAGVELLSQVLSASQSLACTSTTGLLPLCHEAICTWQQAEDRPGEPSRLAVTSVRALVAPMIAVIQARTGARRWCETTFASPAAARTFLRIFPAATFVCLYRSLPGLLDETVRSYPWGLGGSPFWPFSAGHPGNNFATAAKYWISNTQDLLDFETRHVGSCIRIRYEDLACDGEGRAADIYAALGLDPGALAGAAEFGSSGPAAPVLADTSPPVGQVPPQLLARIRDLHSRLAFDPWPDDATSSPDSP